MKPVGVDEPRPQLDLDGLEPAGLGRGDLIEAALSRFVRVGRGARIQKGEPRHALRGLPHHLESHIAAHGQPS